MCMGKGYVLVGKASTDTVELAGRGMSWLGMETTA